MNYLFAKNKFKLQGIPTFTIELVYKGRQPEIQHAIHVHTDSYMFHKENLCRILEKHIPSRFTKLAFLDCDVYFEDDTWYEKTSRLLETHDVVQPFEEAHWLDLTYKHTELTRKTVCLMPGEKWSFEYHPGFAWCMRREWYKKVGFFDYAVSGSGDTLSCMAWLRKEIPPKFQSLPKALYTEYTAFSKLPKPLITYTPGVHLYHLYHGSRKNRQYVERHKLLNVLTQIKDLITVNSDGVYEWKAKERWNAHFYSYFTTRNDDDLSDSVKVADVELTS